MFYNFAELLDEFKNYHQTSSPFTTLLIKTTTSTFNSPSTIFFPESLLDNGVSANLATNPSFNFKSTSSAIISAIKSSNEISQKEQNVDTGLNKNQLIVQQHKNNLSEILAIFALLLLIFVLILTILYLAMRIRLFKKKLSSQNKVLFYIFSNKKISLKIF